jgi:hypothetical protein
MAVGSSLGESSDSPFWSWTSSTRREIGPAGRLQAFEGDALVPTQGTGEDIAVMPVALVTSNRQRKEIRPEYGRGPIV